MLKPTTAANRAPINVVIVTMDTHLASAIDRAKQTLRREIPELNLTLHAASEWSTSPAELERCLKDIEQGDIVVATMLFLEDHFLPILPALQARRDHCDALVCAMSASEVVKLTKIGKFDMGKPASGPMALLKKLRGESKNKGATGGAARVPRLRAQPASPSRASGARGRRLVWRRHLRHRGRRKRRARRVGVRGARSGGGSGRWSSSVA